MAAFSRSSHEILDITTCSICLETFKEPKVLPCIHTFCFHCLDSYYESKKEEMSCPLCKKVFTIPPGGIRDLPNNDFMNQLINVNRSCNTEAQKSDKQLCEMCSESDAEVSSTSYCVDCDQHICDRCSLAHRRANVSRSHQVVPHTDSPSSQKRVKLSVNYCELHPCEQNKLYCYDCKAILCAMCVSKHSQHKLSYVDEAAEVFRGQLSDDVDILSACVLKHETNLEQLEFDTEKFLKNVSLTRNEISQKCDKLVSLIVSHKAELMEQICQFKDKIFNELDIKKDQIERQLVITESFKRYCSEMLNKGTAWDISSTVHDLHARAEELVKIQAEPDCHKLGGVDITFKPSVSTLSSTDSVESLIGELVLGGEAVTMKDDQINEEINLTTFLTKHTFPQVLPSTRLAVAGIMAFGNEVFVVRDTSEVYVYQSDDFTLIRILNITGSKQLGEVVSCFRNSCLYAVDKMRDKIFRYNLIGNITTRWPTSNLIYGLSVTNASNVLAAMYCASRIREYTTSGVLVRDIVLDSSIDHPWHCVQLSTGNYVVCHTGTQQHRVCIVDQSGRIVKSYGGPRGSGVGRLNQPLHLAVDLHDNVLVADSSNKRVQLLSPMLDYLGDVVIPRYQFNDPYVLHYDELNHRLYIGEYDGGRLFALCVS